MRIVFAGTPDFAATALKALLEAGYNLVGVYSQPDRPAGRGRKLMPSPVKQVALDAGIPVFQPVSLKPEDAQQELAALKPDVMIVAAYGLILPKAVLDIPTHGCLNIHASLLPRWRGAAPIQRAIAAGDPETGITIMQMDEGLDTGDMLLKTSTPIHADDTGGSLHDRLADMGGKAIVGALVQLANSELAPEPQNDADANYAHKLSKEEGHIDWSRSAIEIERLIRAFNPWPGTFTDLGEQRIRLHQASALDQSSDKLPGTVISREREGVEVACGTGTLKVTSVQLPGSKAQSISDLINGGKQVLLPGQELN
ncbi:MULTISPECIES: methionyl-tRNA formyltransferase [unclassified Marinobacter]|uniref:methionyl-tRNA formyltransferase n=1 Tax=unclassified Marinobacter TaxID=83889 RepID=UPI001269160D|nr:MULTISPECIES: methionyl-tRNA formyltransferase [unclassified Marinobacter]QFS85246.1 Methionyl-tRNA formyltransferase [Marinobacter sp. THAF197a]QFT49040.1 Methionyl-tRNA formyltransferase [Marinobacter sp. THAF39]